MFEKPIAQQGEKQDNQIQVPHLLNEVHHYIRGKEAGQEPQRTVTPCETAYPYPESVERMLCSREPSRECQHKEQAYSRTDGCP